MPENSLNYGPTLEENRLFPVIPRTKALRRTIGILSIFSYFVLSLATGFNVQAAAMDSGDTGDCMILGSQASSGHCLHSDNDDSTDENCLATGSICSSLCSVACSAILPLYTTQSYQVGVEFSVAMLDVSLPDDLSTSLYRPPRSK